MNTPWRLDSKAPRLADAFRKAAPEQRWRATRLACETSTRTAGLGADDDVKAGLRALEEGRTNDSALRARLIALSGRFDDEYLRLDEEGDQSRKSEVLRLFAKARAAAAVALALTDDDSQLHEAIYEAISALIEKPSEIAGTLEATLRGSTPGC